MLEEVTSDTLTEVGAADGAGGKIIQIRREKRQVGSTLTSGHCGGCEAVSSTLSITQHCSHSDGVLSALLQASHCVHSLTSSVR